MTDTPVTLTDGSGVVRFEGTQSPGGGSQPGALLSADFLFTEQPTAGTYTQSLAVPEGTVIRGVYATAWIDNASWVADTALLNIGDSVAPGAYMTDVDLTGAGPEMGGYDPTSTVGLSVDFASYLGSQAAYCGQSTGTGSFARQQSAFSQAFSGNVRNSADSGPQSIAAVVFDVLGVKYFVDDTITLSVVTTIGSPPVVPVGILFVKILYTTPIAALDGVFVETP